MSDEKQKPYSSHAGGPETEALGHALLIVEKAFGAQCFLVGSATKTTDFRDVDVRMIMEDEAFAQLFGTEFHRHSLNPFWSLLMVSISEYLQKRTGLPIDFQISPRSGVKEADWDKERVPLTMFMDRSDDSPPWRLDSLE